jgi:hypothetical protein
LATGAAARLARLILSHVCVIYHAFIESEHFLSSINPESAILGLDKNDK